VTALGFAYYLFRHWTGALDHDTRHRLKSSMLFWFLLFTTVLDVFRCDPLGGGKHFMYVDYTTRCYTPRHGAMLLYAGAFVLVYPLGIPAMYFVLLYNRRHQINPVLPWTNKKARMKLSPKDVEHAIELRMHNPRISPFSFLYDAYEPEFWWWEVFVCATRLVLTSSNVYLARSIELQPFAVLIMSLINVKLYGLFDPYVSDSDDLIAEIACWNTVATLVFSIIIKCEESIITTEVEIFLNMLLLSVVAILAYYCIITMSTELEFFRESLNIPTIKQLTPRGRSLPMNTSPGTVHDSIEKSQECSSDEGNLTDKSEPEHQNLVPEMEMPSFKNTTEVLALGSPIAELKTTHLNLISEMEMSSAENTTEESGLGIQIFAASGSSNEEDKSCALFLRSLSLN